MTIFWQIFWNYAFSANCLETFLLCTHVPFFHISYFSIVIILVSAFISCSHWRGGILSRMHISFSVQSLLDGPLYFGAKKLEPIRSIIVLNILLLAGFISGSSSVSSDPPLPARRRGVYKTKLSIRIAIIVIWDIQNETEVI